ncbi:MAG: membrane-associated phospholipid phosphatase [halophilic archaeon J07HX64]|nr:MAG: membrane-associated phospholipid phosphatase [halophilic archaeon J07HX64]
MHDSHSYRGLPVETNTDPKPPAVAVRPGKELEPSSPKGTRTFNPDRAIVSGERNLPTGLWDYEVNRAIDGFLPDSVTDGFALATHLGDTAVVAGLVVGFYWLGSADNWRRRGLVVAVAVAALTLNIGLKGVLDVQRPLYAARAAGDPLVFAPANYDGFSTPSGHAMGAAAVYGGLAALSDIGTRRRRALVAGGIIAAVAFSRVVIGVHYVGDVVLGVALGLGLVWVGHRLLIRGRRPVSLVLLLALAGAVLAAPLGSETHAAASIGTAAGGLAVWEFVRDRRPDPSGGAVLLCVLAVATALLAAVVADTLLAVDLVATVGGNSPLSGALRATLSIVAVGFVLALPIFAELLDDDPRARWLQRTLPFAVDTSDEQVGSGSD